MATLRAVRYNRHLHTEVNLVEMWKHCNRALHLHEATNHKGGRRWEQEFAKIRFLEINSNDPQRSSLKMRNKQCKSQDLYLNVSYFRENLIS